MKIIKGLLLVISITFLFGCEESEQGDIVFDDKDFEYIGVTDDDYLLFRNGTDDLEIKVDEEKSMIASYEKGHDIYLIIGEEDSYIIRENGALILACSGEEITCSGAVQVNFSDDAHLLFDVFEEEEMSVTLIIVGILVILAAISLFIVPKRFLNFIKIKNIKVGQLFILRLVTICVLIIGILIILLSF